MKWSPEQSAFINWAATGQGSCILEAVAGAGKTTTLVAAIETIPGQVAVLAYNKKIAEEIKGKIKHLSSKAEAGTVHSFGLKAFRRTFKNFTVDGNKLRKLSEQLHPIGTKLAIYTSTMAKLVSLAKQRALLGEEINNAASWTEIASHFDVFSAFEETPAVKIPEGEIIAAAINLLHKNNAVVDVIDFDDMVYLPLALGLPFWQYDVVMVDEAQDTNPARRLLVKKMVKAKGRVIAVGDRHQAIYGFTGADNNSLDLIAQELNAVRMPLTTTYRCPKSVVSFAQQWVNHIQAHESAPEGVISSSTMEVFLARQDLNSEAAVLCRNTKPLVALALTLIRRKIPCKIEGRDIGATLKKLLTRWAVKNLSALSQKLDMYLVKQIERLTKKKQEDKIGVLEDTVGTLQVIIDQCLKEGKTFVDDAVVMLDALFSDDVTDVLILSTIHKSKGREWKRVFWLDRPGTCPSKYAKQDWQRDQEANLCYVAATRAQNELIELEAAVTGNR